MPKGATLGKLSVTEQSIIAAVRAGDTDRAYTLMLSTIKRKFTAPEIYFLFLRLTPDQQQEAWELLEKLERQTS